MLKTFIIDNSGNNYSKAVNLLEYLVAHPGDGVLEKQEPLAGLIGTAASVKAGIAGRDPFEGSERRLLNLGHTFGHAIEKLSEESIAHGQAVAMGIILAARLAEKIGTAENGLAAQLEADFKKCGLQTGCPYPVTDLGEAMKKDKKAEGALVHFVLPERIGSVVIKDLAVEEAVRLLVE